VNLLIWIERIVIFIAIVLILVRIVWPALTGSDPKRLARRTDDARVKLADANDALAAAKIERESTSRDGSRGEAR
jgi:uncharacterized membrane protein